MKSSVGRSTSTGEGASPGIAPPLSKASSIAPAPRKRVLEQAKSLAEDWYLGLRGKLAGLIKTEATFAIAAKKFEREYAIITERERRPHILGSVPNPIDDIGS